MSPEPRHFSPSPTQYAILQNTIHVTGALSILGALCVITSFIRNGTWRDRSARIVMMIAIADLVSCAAFSVGRAVVDYKIPCTVQGVFIQWGVLASCFWTACLSTNIFIALYRSRTSNADFQRLEPWYHVISWGITGAQTFMLFIAQRPELGPVYAQNTLWCHFATPYDTFRMSMFYGWIWIIFLWNIFAYVSVGRKLYQSEKTIKAFGGASETSEEKRERATQRYVKRASLYLAVFFLNWSFATMNRVQNIAQPDNPLFVLYFLHGFWTPSGGLLNSLVYFYNQRRARTRSSTNKSHNSQNDTYHDDSSTTSFARDEKDSSAGYFQTLRSSFSSTGNTNASRENIVSISAPLPTSYPLGYSTGSPPEVYSLYETRRSTSTPRSPTSATSYTPPTRAPSVKKSPPTYSLRDSPYSPHSPPHFALPSPQAYHYTPDIRTPTSPVSPYAQQQQQQHYPPKRYPSSDLSTHSSAPLVRDHTTGAPRGYALRAEQMYRVEG
ncbi:hypothetical protein HDV00_010054 [Rhizophlyctis rosea]|nr:hypothetical protein HDV00_010054 [Rhizophlyctis rosea]